MTLTILWAHILVCGWTPTAVASQAFFLILTQLILCCTLFLVGTPSRFTDALQISTLAFSSSLCLNVVGGGGGEYCTWESI